MAWLNERGEAVGCAGSATASIPTPPEPLHATKQRVNGMLVGYTAGQRAAKHIAARVLWQRPDISITHQLEVLVGGELRKRHREAIVLVAAFLRVREIEGHEAFKRLCEEVRRGFGDVVVNRALMHLLAQGSVSDEFVSLTASYAAGDYDATDQSGVSRHG
jgi:hypothetical protein